jgi:hypothetical protein
VDFHHLLLAGLPAHSDFNPAFPRCMSTRCEAE